MKILKTLMKVLAGLVVLLIFVFFSILPYLAQQKMNATRTSGPWSPSPEAAALHATLSVVDLHADSLLWNRDLNQRNDIGHVDVPRLSEANVAVQAFTVVTHAPMGKLYQDHAGKDNVVAILVAAQRWPFRTWNSRLERAKHQAMKLAEFETASGGQLSLIKSADDLTAFMQRRQSDPSLVAGFLGLEGEHALEGDLKHVDTLFEAGFRMMAPVHFFDNEVGGSAHGMKKGGLTALGRSVIARQQELGILVDVAHGSEALIDDILSMATRPVVMSHGGVRGTCDNNRNLANRHVDGIAKTGGVIGIGLWQTAVCGEDAAATARAIKYVANRVGVDHVGLGSDYDGTVKAPFDVTGLVLVTEALMKEGFTKDEIGQIMGGNTLRVLSQVLP